MSTKTLSSPDTLPARKTALITFLSRLFREKKLGAIGLIIVVVFFLVGIFADFLAPYGMMEFDLKNRLKGPTLDHWMGTDHFGRDLLSRIIYGARVSMVVGLSACGILILVSTSVGLISGYAGGVVDLVIQRFVDAWLSLPGLFVILTVMTTLGAGMPQTIGVLGAFWGIANIRTVRAVVLSAKENVYVEAARAVGCSTWRILIKHILPQIWAPLIVVYTVALGGIIISEAVISYLGFGIPPPQPSWGGMLSAEGQKYMMEQPWLAFWPGMTLAIVIYGVNMFGDALRDLLDPRLRGNVGRLGFPKKQ
jgi:peptide/nickel transport system permease protein